MSHMVETRGAPGDPMDALGASGRAERQLIENLGTEVFETAVQHGWIDEDDAAFAAGTPRGAALKLLTDIGLLRFDERARRFQDRKSTRLNSSHANISYAVFCLKKKNN